MGAIAESDWASLSLVLAFTFSRTITRIRARTAAQMPYQKPLRTSCQPSPAPMSKKEAFASDGKSYSPVSVTNMFGQSAQLDLGYEYRI